MALKTYSKRYVSPSFSPKKSARHTGQWTPSRFQKLLPVVLMTVGSILLANAIWPILSYELFTSPTLRVADAAVGMKDAPVSVREYLLPTPKPTPVVVSDQLDYTDLSNWFPNSSMPIVSAVSLKTYTLEIPELNIKEAEVAVGGTNLDKHLIQYPGTANPGEYGAPVIFGHSVLRQFYDPRVNNPRRYFSIFSKIMTLNVGDKIFITSDGVKYAYRVVGKTEVKPEDTYILEQRHDVRELKLITCVPEGTYLRRGVVSAQLEEIQ